VRDLLESQAADRTSAIERMAATFEETGAKTDASRAGQCVDRSEA
jgi:hypothetical protein